MTTTRIFGFVFGLAASSLLVILASTSHAQESLLVDRNGDGVVRYAAFGDSITYGVGDGISPGEFIDAVSDNVRPGGYPSRVAALAGIGVDNRGDPGEYLTAEGFLRFPGVAGSTNADIISIYEGTNDSRLQIPASRYRTNLQRMVNVGLALGKEVLLFTTPKPCCNRAGAELFIDSYNSQVKDIADVHGLSLVDIDRAFISSCQNRSQCEFYNRPEGLHPNTSGYDLIAQLVAARLVGIDLFAAEGAALFEQAFALPAGSVLVRPDQPPVTP